MLVVLPFIGFGPYRLDWISSLVCCALMPGILDVTLENMSWY